MPLFLSDDVGRRFARHYAFDNFGALAAGNRLAIYRPSSSRHIYGAWSGEAHGGYGAIRANRPCKVADPGVPVRAHNGSDHPTCLTETYGGGETSVSPEAISNQIGRIHCPNPSNRRIRVSPLVNWNSYSFPCSGVIV
jgi:hypothetical protein